MYIETDRLVLRNFQEKDLEDFFEYRSQKKVANGNGNVPFTDIEQAKKNLEKKIQNKNCFAVVLKENNKVIGQIFIMNVQNQKFGGIGFDYDSVKEISNSINQKYWNKGYSTEAYFAVAKYCFEVLKLKCIFASCFEKNEASKKVQQKLGLKPFLTIKDRIWLETNEPCDFIYFKLDHETKEIKNFNAKFLE